jgi:hypothetical protein
VREGKPKESKKVGKYLENYRNEIKEDTNILGAEVSPNKADTGRDNKYSQTGITRNKEDLRFV